MLFDYSPADVDEDLRRQDRADRAKRRRMFAYCSECMSNGHRPGCPEATEEDQQQDEDQGETT